MYSAFQAISLPISNPRSLRGTLLSNWEQDARAATAPSASICFLNVSMGLEVDPDSN